MSGMQILFGSGLFTAMISALIGAALPRFSAYFLGPLLLFIAIAAAAIFGNTNLHTEGSPAGLVVGGALVFAIIIGGCGGLVLISVGAWRIRQQDQLPAPGSQTPAP